jgi:hypothetical protein
MEIHGTLVQLFHHAQYFSLRTRGNQQTTGSPLEVGIMAAFLGLLFSLSSITFGPIVGKAEHLAVVGRASAALTPRCNVVRIHFVELIDPALVRVVANRTEWTVGLAFPPAACVCLAYAPRFTLVSNTRTSSNFVSTESPNRNLTIPLPLCT